MSGGVSGSGGISRFPTSLEAGEPAAVDALVTDLKAAKGTGPGWMSFLDSDSSTKKLADKLLADGKFDEADARALMKDAKDYGKITEGEKKVFVNLLRDHAAQITPVARDALAKFFGVPVGRPPLAVGSFPGEMVVVPGSSEYSLDDDTLVMTGEGRFQSSIDREIYTAGYLPMKEGPMLKPMGTASKPSSVLPDADNAINKDRSPVDRLDEAMKRGTGTAGGLAKLYAKEGKRDDADSWWGFCDRWSYNALDPEVATRVNEPIMYKGVYFSTAELRGLASFTGRSDEKGGLFDKDVTPLDLQKATAQFLKKNGPGFISDVWLDKAHPGNSQVWNQPFDAVDQDVKELKGDELQKVLKEQFKLEGNAAAGKKLYYVETKGHYGVEVGDEHEGAASHSSKTWKSYILADADGKALDGKWAPGSDDAPEYIWRPNRSGQHTTKEAAFFRDMLKGSVPAAKVTSFEAELGATPQAPLDASKKAAFVAKWKGMANAYPDAALDAKLRPLGLKASDLK